MLLKKMFRSKILRFISVIFFTFVFRFIYVLYLSFFIFSFEQQNYFIFHLVRILRFFKVTTSSLKRYYIIQICKSLTCVANCQNARGQSSCYIKESVSLPSPIIYVLTLLTIHIYITSSAEDAFNEVLDRHSQSILIGVSPWTLEGSIIVP